MDSMPIEITEIISCHLSSIFDLVSLKRTCSNLHANLSLHLCEEETDIEVLALLYPPEDYSVFNPDEFSYRFVSRNMDKNWNIRRLSEYKYLDDNLVRNNPSFPWNYADVCINSGISLDYAYELFLQHREMRKFYNPNMAHEFICKVDKSKLNWPKLTRIMDTNYILTSQDLPWRWKFLTENPTLTLAHITSNPNIPWELSNCRNPEIIKHLILTANSDFILTSHSKYVLECVYVCKPELIWKSFDFEEENTYVYLTTILSRLALTNIACFEANIDNNIWDFDVVSTNITDDTFPVVFRHLNKEWNWKTISHRVSWNIIINCLQCPWYWNTISANPSVTIDIVRNNPQYPWSWLGLSFNDNLTFEYLETHREEFLPYMDNVSLNVAITLQDINNNSEFGWKWGNVSIRKDVTALDILRYSSIRWIVKNVRSTSKKAIRIRHVQIELFSEGKK